jgi:hypothetical protein
MSKQTHFYTGRRFRKGFLASPFAPVFDPGRGRLVGYRQRGWIERVFVGLRDWLKG